MKREHPILKRPANTIVSKYSKNDWKLLECLETGLVYLDNPVSYQELESDYAWEKTFEEEKSDRKRREPMFSKLSVSMRRVRKFFRPIPKLQSLITGLAASHFGRNETLQLLDIGCGRGTHLKMIAHAIQLKTGIPVVPRGIEISTILAPKANLILSELGGGAIHASALAGIGELPNASLDLIILHSFLEHEINPLDLLRACRKKLAKEGLLVIKVPNYASLNRKVRQGRWCGFRYPDHVNYFSPHSIRLILDQAEMKVHRMNFFDRFPTSDNLWVIAKAS
jgi:SAM-dependent methyltransferase